MASATDKTINGITFTNVQEPIAKLASLECNVVYEVIDIDSNKTRFNSRVITVLKDGGDKSFKVYMPEYVAKPAEWGSKFIHEGLQKNDKSGHSYHSVLWAK